MESKLVSKQEQKVKHDNVREYSVNNIIIKNNVVKVKNSFLIRDLNFKNNPYRLFHYDTEVLTFHYDDMNRIVITHILPVSNSTSRCIKQVLTFFTNDENSFNINKVYSHLYSESVKDLRSRFQQEQKSKKSE